MHSPKLLETYLKTSFRAVHQTLSLEAHILDYQRPQIRRKTTGEYTSYQCSCTVHSSRCGILRLNSSETKNQTNSVKMQDKILFESIKVTLTEICHSITVITCLGEYIIPKELK